MARKIRGPQYIEHNLGSIRSVISRLRCACFCRFHTKGSAASAAPPPPDGAGLVNLSSSRRETMRTKGVPKPPDRVALDQEGVGGNAKGKPCEVGHKGRRQRSAEEYRQIER